MDYTIALAPDLGISADEFCAAWNDTPECQAVAAAVTDPDLPTPRTFEPFVTAAAIVTLVALVKAVATTTLNELIKKTIEKWLAAQASQANPRSSTTQT